MHVLNLEQIKAAAASRQETTDVETPEWGGRVRLTRLGAVAGMELGRMYNAAARDAEGNLQRAEDLVAYYALLLSHSIVDGEGQLLFASAEGRRFLRSQSLGLLTRLGMKALEFNGLAGEVDQAEKNSKTPATPSPSPSVEP